VKQLLLAGSIVVAGVFASPFSASQQTPVFRAGVDLMTVDVVVLDKSGSPVRDLTAADFSVVAGGRPRRVVAADFLNTAVPARSAAAHAAPSAASNQRLVSPRTIMLLIDADEIPSGGGRLAFKGIAGYLARFSREDRIGVMSLLETPRVSPTTDRAKVADAIGSLVGTSMRFRDRDMTFGEASGVANRQRQALLAFFYRVVDQGYGLPGGRTCAPPQGFESLVDVPAVCVQAAEGVLERARHQTARVLDRLSAIAVSLAAVPGPKSIVLVSGGLYSDARTTNQMADFAKLAERARISVHTLLVEAEGGSGAGSSTETRRLDSQVGFGGLVDLAAAARGSAQRLPGESTEALNRIDRGLSGYYEVSFERDPADEVGLRLPLDVRTKRDGATVLSRKGVTPSKSMAAASRSPADLKGTVGELLASAVTVTQLPIEIAAFVLPAQGTGGEGRAILAVELGQAPAGVAALGFQIAEASGRVVADGFDAPGKVQGLGADRSAFVTTVPVNTGNYIARFAFVDSEGRRGSLQYAFAAPAWPAGPIRVSDVILGEGEGAAFRPSARVPASGKLSIRVVIRDSASTFHAVTARAFVTRAGDDGPLEMVELPLTKSPDPVRGFADGTVDTTYYPLGEYLVSVTVSVKGTEIGRMTRLFAK
jgi:VWFA-related protein